MKIVLTGATGFVGGEVLEQLLSNSRTDLVTCVSRRPVAVDHPKLQIALHTDFTVWPRELAERFADHSAVIWTLGAKATEACSQEEYERTTVTTTLSFAKAVASCLKAPFHFCYLSGMGADPAEKSTLPWQRDTRHMKGRAERGLEKLAHESDFFSATSFRPGGILPESTSRILDLLLSPIAVRVDRLAQAMIQQAMTEHRASYRLVSNRAIRQIGGDPSRQVGFPS